jgi:hypothetical protein
VCFCAALFTGSLGAQQFPRGPGNPNCPDDIPTGAVF